MPRRLERAITQALRDGKVDVAELKALAEQAKADDVLSPEERSRLQALLDTHGDAFEPKARQLAAAFLEGGAVASTGPLPDPRLSWETTEPLEQRTRPGGVLALDGFHYDDVIQNELGDCYLMASLSALAASRPSALADAITDHGDGTFTVRFFEKQGRGPLRPVEVRVDADLPTRADGSLPYGRGRDPDELWPALVEKAYATWKGGYSEITMGGFASDALTALTGAPADFHNPIQELKSQELWTLMKQAHGEGRAMVTGTGTLEAFGGDGARGYAAMHMYAIVALEDVDGEKRVTLRNPYGKDEPGNDGVDDGVFQLSFREYRRFFEDLYVLRA